MVRLKNRYLLLEVTWKDGKLDETFTEQPLLHALREAVATNFGDYGLGSNLSSLQVKYYSPYTNLAIVRCATSEQQRVISSLALTSQLRQRTALIRVLRVAGTLPGCHEDAVARSAQLLGGARLGKQLTVAQELHLQLQALQL